MRERAASAGTRARSRARPTSARNRRMRRFRLEILAVQRRVLLAVFVPVILFVETALHLRRDHRRARVDVPVHAVLAPPGPASGGRGTALGAAPGVTRLVCRAAARFDSRVRNAVAQSAITMLRPCERPLRRRRRRHPRPLDRLPPRAGVAHARARIGRGHRRAGQVAARGGRVRESRAASSATTTSSRR